MYKTYIGYGDYCITVITPVCGTGNLGSIPSSRPNAKKLLREFFCIGATKDANNFAYVWKITLEARITTLTRASRGLKREECTKAGRGRIFQAGSWMRHLGPSLVHPILKESCQTAVVSLRQHQEDHQAETVLPYTFFRLCIWWVKIIGGIKRWSAN